ncbi:MAG: hypothetical protein K6347_03465 [Campylobacterales bacterium]
MKHRIVVAGSLAAIAFLLSGCGADQPKITLSDIIKRSYKIEKGMSKEVVSTLLELEPTTMQRVNNDELWKYEGNQRIGDQITYHNLTLKFRDGKVSNVGTFSCKVPEEK